ncbi:hypothetical protein [Sulfurimonas sp.]|uniref:hypothetical protein n=1 Tax=Sulfurimonas sp. TaxID=2022749 RepID=UPI002AB1C045|nr:hypothetical protein [Sulfurimonas sp.]
MKKYANFFILFFLLSIGVLFKDYINISTNLLSLFASKDAISKLDIANKLGYSKDLLIAVKGFDKNSKTKVQEIVNKLSNLQQVTSIIYTLEPSKSIKKYYKKNYVLLATFNETKQTKSSIYNKLKSLYDAQFNSVFYTAIDKNDPLRLFSFKHNKNKNFTNKGKYLTLGNYGYLIKASTTISPAQMNEAKILYKEIKHITSSYKEVIAFAPFFYTVENSTQIQKDVQFIIIMSTIALLFIYYIVIKNIRLLSQIIIVLASSMIFAGLISTIFFDNFNILSLAFGMSLTAVSIDYVLHYHFHNFYQNKKVIDKNVLYGFLTTTVAFGIFSFIPIPIISQISIFAVFSLSFAYFLFTFVFPYLELKEYKSNNIPHKYNQKIPASLIFMLSVAMLIYSVLNLKLDNNIRNLDYQNHNLKNIEQIFKRASKVQMHPIIVQAKTKEELLDNLYKIHKELPDTFSYASLIPSKGSCLKHKNTIQNYDFNTLNTLVNIQANKIGFKKDYFLDAYKFTKNIPTCDITNLDIFKQYGLNLYNDNHNYFSIALVSNTEKIQKFKFFTSIDAKKIFAKMANKMYIDLTKYSSFVIVIIFILLLLSVKKNHIYALNYILFPLSLTLAIIVTMYDVNIMHLFSLIILIAIGIDYGIYMSNTNKTTNTRLAIRYSLLSTFSAFGVLIFSSITALNSIGVVISIGCASIFLLVKVMK